MKQERQGGPLLEQALEEREEARCMYQASVTTAASEIRSPTVLSNDEMIYTQVLCKLVKNPVIYKLT